MYFFDDFQTLIGNEEGTEENFRRHLINVEEYQLSSSIRVPNDYLNAVKSILDGKMVRIKDYDLRLFDDIISMLNELRKRKEEGRKVALICSFTESEGDTKNKTEWNLKNMRIGYPLQSGFDLYKNVNIRIKWLMDEKVEYPKYWRGELDPLGYCASVYGAQGFEADYVGVVWGRDMIWRDSWTVDPSPITDYVGGGNSLSKIAKRDKDRALKLLKNRYYVMLTRGIRGVYIFFEDYQTGEKNEAVNQRLVSATWVFFRMLSMTMIVLEYKGLKIYLKDVESLNAFLIKYGISRDEVTIIYG
ncbi:DNA/RNA helicase domain-containing protein [Metallosphaera hakonensis]|uniref:DNA/RNA helicase domain-containing protein n=1 Tax=Metallosphaera hakonensis TaxID=79601 RepID=UPI000B021B90|nr:DNA/RNA helicase domain-containing protein [Metallosphaera hakonensis]